MAEDVAIRAEGLGKKYVIGHAAERERYVALRDVLARNARNLARTTIDLLRGRPMVVGDEVEEFWALRDVNFEIRRGDVVGVIGRNGAGKSTLLKILSRITEPSEGRVTIRGRVASLLEVGTGFHPELTGRENIYLNGAILGMTHAEIRRKFDEIVAFAEVERFLDTPVKRFSSGMYVRLAFAVAAHLEPEILVVDEVLAVGDAEFQKKCLGKMGEVAGEGRTVLFVSHNMGSVQSLCSSAVLLVNGRIAASGPVAHVTHKYTEQTSTTRAKQFAPDLSRPHINAVHVDPDELLKSNLVVDITFASPYPLSVAVGGITLRALSGEPVWGSNSRFHPADASLRGLQHGTVRCEVKNIPLVPGAYLLSAWLADWHENHDSKLDALTIVLGTGVAEALRPSISNIGALDWPARWTGSQRLTCGDET